MRIILIFIFNLLGGNMIIVREPNHQLGKIHTFMTFIALTVMSFAITATNVSANEVNVYSARKGYLLEPLVEAFKDKTDIKVNVISGKAKVLQKRIKQEGKNTRADVLLTVDAGNLYKAKKPKNVFI